MRVIAEIVYEVDDGSTKRQMLDAVKNVSPGSCFSSMKGRSCEFIRVKSVRTYSKQKKEEP
jgi:hypothetical protein